MSKTILVVEDTQMLRRMYSDRLEHDGYRVLNAADGTEALALMRSDTPDLILLDLIMPRMGGLEVLDHVMGDPRLKTIPVLILSNLGQEADIKRGLEMGAADYLIKNEARPNDVALRVAQLLAKAEPRESCSVSTGLDPAGGGRPYKLLVRDHEGDADRFVADANLERRLWCPACEVELVLELVVKTAGHGWYEAHIMCPQCCREF